MSRHPALLGLADFLCERKEMITGQWLTAVKREPRIASADAFPASALVDHLPQLFDDVTDELRRADDPSFDVEAARHARIHGDHRWHQHFRLEELLREIAVLHSIFLDHIAEYRATNPEFSGAVELLARQIVREFFGSMAIESAAAFSARREQELEQHARAVEGMNRALEAANAQLQQVDSTRLRTLRTVAHELVNSLQAMKAGVAMISRETDEVSRTSTARMLSRNIEEMAGLAHRLLDFATLLSQGDQLHNATCRLEPLFEELLVAGQALAQAKGLAFAGTIDPDLGPVVTDESKIRRVAMNLLTNAVKYTTQGGINLDIRRDGSNHWTLTVTDSGVGIPPDEMENVFQEFHRLPNAEKETGAGLGLAITRQLVALLGGTIEARSEFGRGSSFSVKLTRAPEAA